MKTIPPTGMATRGLAVGEDISWDIPTPKSMRADAVISALLDASSDGENFYAIEYRTSDRKTFSILTRRDIADTLPEEGIDSIEVLASGHLVSRLETLFSDGMKTPQTTRAMWLIRMGIMSRGRKLQPAFIVRSKADVRVTRRYYLPSDVEAWIGFALFCRSQDLDAETVSSIASLHDASMGFVLYHLWIHTNKLLGKNNVNVNNNKQHSDFNDRPEGQGECGSGPCGGEHGEVPDGEVHF